MLKKSKFLTFRGKNMIIVYSKTVSTTIFFKKSSVVHRKESWRVARSLYNSYINSIFMNYTTTESVFCWWVK